MIRFRIPADGVELLELTYSPLLETVISLHVLASPRHHALQHQWVRAMRKLPPPLRRELGALSFAYANGITDLVYPEATGGFPGFDEELERLQSVPAKTVAFEFLRPLVDHGGRRNPALLADTDIRRLALRRARAAGGDPAAASLLFDDPRALVKRFAAFVRSYWEEAFQHEWERIEPQLAAAVEHAGRRLAGGDVFDFLDDVSPRLRVDRAAGELTFDLPHEHTVELGGARRLTLVPSVYSWPHTYVNCDPPWPLALVYPAPSVAARARPRLPDAELLKRLRALADDTRLRALRLIAEHPRSTQELAPIVGISEAGLSKHLRLLADAGLLTTRREGYYVLYSLADERLGRLSDDLLRHLGR